MNDSAPQQPRARWRIIAPLSTALFLQGLGLAGRGPIIRVLGGAEVEKLGSWSGHEATRLAWQRGTDLRFIDALPPDRQATLHPHLQACR